MSKFKYGDSWEKYPIKPNEIWGVGDHVIACGDIEAGNAETLLAKYGQPDFAFVDPPWNKGNAKAFLTKANIDRSVDFDVFLDRIISLIKQAKHDVLIEFGNQLVGAVKERIAKEGRVIKQWDVVYYGKNPCKMLHCAWGSETISAGDCSGMDEMKIPSWFFKHANSDFLLGKTLFDPCMGQGLTAVTAQSFGMRALGLELNPRRAAVTIEKLAKATDCSPSLIGSF